MNLQMPARRMALAIPAAVVMTLVFFSVMQALVGSGKSVAVEEGGGRLGTFVKLQSDDGLNTLSRKPEKQQVERAPDAPAPKMDMKTDSRLSVDHNVRDFSFAGGFDIDASISGGDGEGDYLPIVKVQPMYPDRASSRGIEGHVLLEFTVTKIGTVENIRVIEAVPPGIFNQAAIQAASKFKYKPRVINGQAVDVPGVQNLIRFQLAK